MSSQSAVFPTVDGKGARLPNPSRPLSEAVQTNNLIINFDSGHEQRRKKSEPRRTWSVAYSALSQIQYDTIYNFFIARGGSYEAFLWTHPVTGAQHLVRFNEDTMQADNVEHGKVKGAIWKLAFKLIEVL